MNILVVRLITSEEIIAQVDTENNPMNFGKLKLINPAAIINRQTPTGQPTMGLADYIPMAEKKEALLNESVILFTYKPVIELINAYNQAFGSGLVMSSTLAKPVTKSFTTR